MTDEITRKQQAKEYEKIKLITGIIEGVLSFLLILAFIIFGFTKKVEVFAAGYFSNPYLKLLLFGAILGFITSVLSFPFDYFFGFRLEHKYGLSNLTFWGWIKEKLKGFLVGIVLGLPIVLLFYYLLSNYEYWWMIFGLIVTLYSVLLAQIAPIFIFPLFYKFRPINDEALKNRIISLCEKVGFKIKGVYTFDMSKTTKKANAAFAGIGKTRRIIIGDTLISGFSHDEIETVFAHELGHYKKGHIKKQIFLSFFSTFAGLFVVSWLYDLLLPVFGFHYRWELAALPLLMLIAGTLTFLLGPIGAYISRKYEYEADKFAVETTGNFNAFKSTMEKLAFQNLADDEPHGLVEFWFHSHPSIKKRIQAVEGYCRGLARA
ncbi:MAG TPA: M48 family metallopeptidase [Ignavibacteria bacterium]|jgi:STE24 endopeptidase